MEILFVSTELTPYVKVGGLADVVSALTKTLRQLGHKVTLAMPRFPAFERGGMLVARRLTPLTFDLAAPVEVTVYDGRLASGVELVLLDVPGLFDRPGVYGEGGEDYPDNARRFGVFARAVAELVRQRALGGSGFDVVSTHDWPTALVAVYLRELEKVAPAPLPPTVLTLHNLAHQGVFPKETLSLLGLPETAFHPEYLEYYGKVNWLKGGIVSAKKIVTVSRTYADEVLTEEHGAGLDGVLRNRAADVVGIANGIDYATWNPATDPALAARYDAEDTSNKGRCKTALIRQLGLEVEPDGVDARPLVAFVGRLVHQKGADLLPALISGVVREGGFVVVAGEGDDATVSAIETAVRASGSRAALARAAPEATVHALFAAADMVLIPSRFEPCGLVQLYAQRYGALPIAHATGGLRDTVVDCDAALETGTGFLFDEVTVPAALGAFGRALGAYRSPRWRALCRRVMRLDLGWDRPARRYDALLRSAVGG